MTGGAVTPPIAQPPNPRRFVDRQRRRPFAGRLRPRHARAIARRRRGEVTRVIARTTMRSLPWIDDLRQVSHQIGGPVPLHARAEPSIARKALLTPSRVRTVPAGHRTPGDRRRYGARRRDLALHRPAHGGIYFARNRIDRGTRSTVYASDFHELSDDMARSTKARTCGFAILFAQPASHSRPSRWGDRLGEGLAGRAIAADPSRQSMDYATLAAETARLGGARVRRAGDRALTNDLMLGGSIC